MSIAISIPAGTIVFGEESGRLTLKGDVYVQASRHEDGSWGYEIRGEQFSCAGGLANWTEPIEESFTRTGRRENWTDSSSAWRHVTGLVAFS